MAKKIVVFLIFIVTAIISNGFAQQVIDKIAAIVEDDIILASELTQYSLNLAFQREAD